MLSIMSEVYYNYVLNRLYKNINKELFGHSINRIPKTKSRFFSYYMCEIVGKKIKFIKDINFKLVPKRIKFHPRGGGGGAAAPGGFFQ